MRPRRYVRSGLALTSAVGAALIVACKGGGESGGTNVPPAANANDFSWSPPAVEEATIQPLAPDARGGNALLEVTFEKGDDRIGKAVTIFPHGKPVELRDDGERGDGKAGDGVFSAVVDFDFKELAQQAADVARKADKLTGHTIFRGREAVGFIDAELVRANAKKFAAFRDFNTVIRDRLRFSLFDTVPSVDPADVLPDHSLMITATGVVTDPDRTINPCVAPGDADGIGDGNPNGVWTFKHLVTEMVAGTGVDPADFVESWLRLWDSNQPVASGFIAAPRHNIIPRVLDPWPRKAGKLDLDKAPFRLAAIVNRMDLGANSVYGGGSAGEGRFVFGVWDRTAPGCTFMPFSVIFEYGIPRSGCHAVREWAQKWVALSSMGVGTPPYNAALEAITEEFAKAGAAPSKPNRSALNQLRTNENALNSLWELREFQIASGSHLLQEVTTKQTTDETLNNTPVLAQYINANAALIKLDRHVVPNRFPPPANPPFMAATSRASPGQTNTHFRAPGITDNDARFHFSLNTCSACHIRETSTNGTINGLPGGNTAFLHVDPKFMPAHLSRFLTGASESIDDSPDLFLVDDPVIPTGPKHPFNDLDNRRNDLAKKAGSSCFRFILIPPRRLLDRLPPIGPDGVLPPIRDPRLDGFTEPNRMVH